MNSVELVPSYVDHAAPATRCGRDLLLFGVILLMANLSLLTGHGTPFSHFAFLPGLIAAGEWWRIIAHPFAHISLYHLLLDAGAFLLLYHGLRALSSARRLALFAGSAAGSLALAGLSSTFSYTGLCGLSGAAHGLMASSALLSARADDESERQAGRILLFLVVGKALFEAATGRVLFVTWHLGDVGLPNAYCHLGGVLGGLAAYALQKLAPNAETREERGGKNDEKVRAHGIGSVPSDRI